MLRVPESDHLPERHPDVLPVDDLAAEPAVIESLLQPPVEPLLGPLPKLNLDGINWVIVGGESGPGARPLEREPALSEVEGWVIGVRDQCLAARMPFFFKQWGGVQKKKAGRELDGRTWDEMPVSVNLVRA